MMSSWKYDGFRRPSSGLQVLFYFPATVKQNEVGTTAAMSPQVPIILCTPLTCTGL